MGYRSVVVEKIAILTRRQPCKGEVLVFVAADEQFL